MKSRLRAILLTSVLVIALIAMAEVSASSNVRGARIRLTDKILDFGHFRTDELRDSMFTIYNDGDSTLVIHTIFTGCGCTRTTCDKKIVEPGDSTIVQVRFNSKGRPLGGFRKSVVIRSNAINNPARVYVDGVIVK